MLLLDKCLFFVSAVHDAITTNSRLAQRRSSCPTNKRLKVQVLHRLPTFSSEHSSVCRERAVWGRKGEGSNPSVPKKYTSKSQLVLKCLLLKCTGNMCLRGYIMREKKTKGDIAVTYVISRLTELGWTVGILITEHAKYDLLAEKAGKMIRVQARSVKLKDNGSIEIPLRNTYADRHGCYARKRNVGDYDVLAVYCQQMKSVYFITDEILANNSSGFSLRIKKTENGQTKRVHFASDFQLL